jgi:hypothetical protein
MAAALPTEMVGLVVRVILWYVALIVGMTAAILVIYTIGWTTYTWFSTILYVIAAAMLYLYSS